MMILKRKMGGKSYDAAVAAIRALVDPVEIQDAIDQLSMDAEKIKAQLEFINEDDTEEWEYKAQNALAYKRALHRVALKHAETVIKTPVKIANAQAAEAKRILKAKRTELHLQRFNDKAVRRAEHLEMQRLANERRMDAQFSRFARMVMSPEQVAECERLARDACQPNDVSAALAG